MEGSRLDGVGKLTISSTNGIIFSDNTTVSTANSLGMRNRIINGDMRIDQRNAGAAVTVSDAGTYTVDRYIAANNSGTGVVTNQQSTLGNSRSLKLTATSAVTDLTTSKYIFGVHQRIEGNNCADLNGKTITISFKVDTNWTGNLPVALLNSAANRSYIVDVAVVSGVNTVVVSVLLEAATVVIGTGRGVSLTIGFNNEAIFKTATTGAWIAGELYVSNASTQWTKTTGNYINVTEVQLELGSVATPFERRPIGMELSLCQRYYAETYIVAATAIGTGGIYPTGYWPVQMRATPSITTAGNSGSGGGWGAMGFTAFYQYANNTNSSIMTIKGLAEL
jgi:hypothetical protein